MDERYFMYIEDMDWCRRFWRNGYEVWYLPDWKVEHLGSKGSTKDFRITNKLMWVHLISYFKYYFKWLRLSLPLL
jgi:GT2 family glycosyltransferase